MAGIVTRSSLEALVGVTGALALTARYVFDQQGFSYYCIAGGLAAMEADFIASKLPASVVDALAYVPFFDTAGETAAALIGGVALEMSINGTSVAALANVQSLQVIAVGAAASMAGMWVAKRADNWLKQIGLKDL